MTVKICPHCGSRVFLDYESGICPKCGCPVYADDQLNHRHKNNSNGFKKEKEPGMTPDRKPEKNARKKRIPSWLIYFLALLLILIITPFFVNFLYFLFTPEEPIPELPQDYSYQFDYDLGEDFDFDFEPEPGYGPGDDSTTDGFTVPEELQELIDELRESNEDISSGEFSQLLIPDLLDTDISSLKHGLILKDEVWHNQMSQISSPKTDAFTKKDGKFVPDIEDALENLYQSRQFSHILTNSQLQLIILDTLEEDIDVLDAEPAYTQLLLTYCKDYKKAAELLTAPADDYNAYVEEYTAVLDTLFATIEQLQAYN